MKKGLWILIISLILVLCLSSCKEDDPDIKASVGLEYSSVGDGTCIVKSMGSCTDTDVVVPAISPSGEPVVAIGYRAFADSEITSITLPDTLLAINMNAFENCAGLTGIIIPEGVVRIGDFAFASCTGLKEISLPDGLKTIGAYAFGHCYSLTGIDIPDSVTSIGNVAFGNCNSLTEVTIPDGVTEINFASFIECKNLVSVTLPKGITTIGEAAFLGSNNVVNVFYKGNAEDFAKIKLSNDNTSLTNTRVYLYSEEQPDTEGDFWHYVDGTAKIWTE